MNVPGACHCHSVLVLVNSSLKSNRKRSRIQLSDSKFIDNMIIQQLFNLNVREYSLTLFCAGHLRIKIFKGIMTFKNKANIYIFMQV